MVAGFPEQGFPAVWENDTYEAWVDGLGVHLNRTGPRPPGWVSTWGILYRLEYYGVGGYGRIPDVRFFFSDCLRGTVHGVQHAVLEI